jgi:PASTA domain
MNPQAGRRRPRERPDTPSILEVLAHLATIVAAMLMLLAFFGVQSAHQAVDRNQPTPPATAALHPASTLRVPPVGGLLEAEAASVLAKSGFRVRVDYAPTIDGTDVGRVLGQAPAPGSPSSHDTQVAIVVGSASGR